MIALPKATSQGSNGGGGGALTALPAISAARAEPESSASAVASKTVFFMTIPIVVRSVRLRRPQAQRHRLRLISAVNLRGGTVGVKRKRRANDAFLGVLRFAAEVVDVCCNPTTTVGAELHEGRKRQRASGADRAGFRA